MAAIWSRKLGVAIQRDEESLRHAAARHPAEHQEPQKSSPSTVLASRMIVSVNWLLTHGIIPLRGPSQFLVVSSPIARTSPFANRADDPLEDFVGPLAWPSHLGQAPQEVFGGDHVEDRADILGHSAVNENQAPRQRVLKRRRARIARMLIEQLVRGQKPAAADSVLGVSFGRWDAMDQLDPGEDAAGILPAAARSPEPFSSENRARDDHACFFLIKRSGQAPCLACGSHQERLISEASEDSSKTASRDPLGMSFTLLTTSSPCPGRTIRARS